MKILKSFNVKLTKLQIKEIRNQLKDVKGNFAIIAQPRMKLSVFEIEDPSMDVAIVDSDLHRELSQSLEKSKCEPRPKS